MRKEKKEVFHPYDLKDIILLLTNDNYMDLHEAKNLYTFLKIRHQIKVKTINVLESSTKSIESYLRSGNTANPLDSYDGLITEDIILEFTIDNRGVYLGEKKLLNI